MPALFTFLFKVNIALVLFCLGYYAVLRHLTFYTLNRVYLVTAILFASVYPWINVNNFVQRHQQLTAPVQHIIIQWKAPAANLVKPLDQPDYWQWGEIVFWAGALLLAIRLVMQLFSLYRLYKNSEPGTVHTYPVRLIDGDVSPFSFWRSIYVNPGKLSPADLEKVLEHEHIHVSEWHTLDILLAELSTVFYWFNPGIWLIKKAVRENIEFITDRKILQKGADSKQYQYSLLTVSMAGAPNKLVNNFNISTIKKRIIMMNTKRSSRINLTRYMFVAPAVVILLLAFSISKAAITKKGLSTIKSITTAIKSVTISGDDRPIAHPALTQTNKAVPAVLKTIATARVKKADTIYARKSKDGTRTMFVSNDKSLDSVGYVINGAKSTRADLLALDPAKIYSLDLIPAKQGKKFVDFILDKPDILFVTTDDSEKGRYLKERIDKDMRQGVLAGTRNMDLPGSDNAPTPPPSSGATTTVYSYSITPSPDNAPKVAVNGSGNVSTNQIYISTKTPNGKPITLSVKPVTTVIGKDGIVTPDGQKIAAPNMAAEEVITVDSNGTEHKNFLYRKRGADNISIAYTSRVSDGGTTIDNFHNGVLYIIDGKEAKSLKGLAADEIASITVLNDESAKKKYGDKGKNGVIIISTKKGGK